MHFFDTGQIRFWLFVLLVFLQKKISVMCPIKAFSIASYDYIGYNLFYNEYLSCLSIHPIHPTYFLLSIMSQYQANDVSIHTLYMILYVFLQCLSDISNQSFHVSRNQVSDTNKNCKVIEHKQSFLSSVSFIINIHITYTTYSVFFFLGQVVT